MRKLILLIAVIALFGASVEAARSYKSKKEFTYYEVKKGDSLSVIAKKFNTTTKKIISINKLKKRTLLIGQKLKVPAQKSQKKRKKGVKKFITYKVDKGDTIAYIARRFHITKKEVAVINDLDMYKLPKAGKILKIPNYKYWSSKKERLKDLKLDLYEKLKKPKIYVVQSGDTLFSIARKYKTPIKELADANNLSATSLIRVGQKLKIPAKSYSEIAQDIIKKKPKKEPQKPIYYTVKKGDSLIKIAKEQKIPLKELLALNNLTTKSTLFIGKKLLIKKGDETNTKKESKTEDKKVAKKKKSQKKYIVKSGDTLWSIAKKHNISIKKLRELNNLKNKDIILDGMVLIVEGEVVKKKSTKSVKVAKKTKKKKTKVALKKNRKKSRHRDVSVNKVIRIAKRYLGTRYVWGAEGPRGFDCSGFTQYVMKKSKGITIPRVSRRQAYYGKYVSRKNLKPGDLIFFDTSWRRRGYVNHVGIYIGNGKFIHASSARHRVVITSLNSPFYKARFKWGRRIN